MRNLFLLSAIGLVACDQEFNVSSNVDAYGEPNPSELETPTKVERVVQVTTPEVDILWAVDNSCSMIEEQTALSQNFPVFMRYFLGSGLDYHVGVVSTDMDDPNQQGNLREVRGLKWIDDETEFPEDVFTAMAQMGTGGSGDERGRAAIYTAIEIKKDGANAGFIRDDASLHIVVISDEQDHSGNNPIGREEFAEYLLDLKKTQEMVSFSSIVYPEGAGGGGLLTDEEPGTEYLWVTRNVGGIEWDIRTDSWDEVLQLLGLQAAGLKREFFLSELPVPGTIKVSVKYDGIEYAFEEGVDWEYNAGRNSVLFLEYVPEALAEVYVTYQILSDLQDSEG